MSDSPEKREILGQWAKDKLGLQVAHQAAMLQDAQQLLQGQRELTQASQRKLLNLPEPAAEGGDDMIHVGDRIEPHYHLPTPPRTGSPWLKLAALAALSATGGGALVIGLSQAVGQWLNRPVQTSAPAEKRTPTAPQEWEIQWRFDGQKVEFGKPKRVE